MRKGERRRETKTDGLQANGPNSDSLRVSALKPLSLLIERFRKVVYEPSRYLLLY